MSSPLRHLFLPFLLALACQAEPEPCFPPAPIGSEPDGFRPCGLSDEEFLAYGNFEGPGLNVSHSLCFSQAECPLDCDPERVMTLIREDFAMQTDLSEVEDEAPLCFESQGSSDCCYVGVFRFPAPGPTP